MKRTNLFGIAASALAIVLLFAACPTGGDGTGGGPDPGPGGGTTDTTLVYRNAYHELTITQTRARAARLAGNERGSYTIRHRRPTDRTSNDEIISEGEADIGSGGVIQCTPTARNQEQFTITITGDEIAGFIITVTAGNDISIDGLVERRDPVTAVDLAKDINALKWKSPENAASEGRAEADGATATVRITGGFVEFRDTIIVPAGVTLDLTGAAVRLHNVALTVNGTVNARNEYIRLGDNAEWAAVNGSGTINLRIKGRLFYVQRNMNIATRTLTIDGVTLVGLTDNTDSLVEVGAGGVFVLQSGTIRGNNTSNLFGGGSGVRVGAEGTFTMNGGTISGNAAYYLWGGGGVHVGGGTFTMNGGTISGNTAGYDSMEEHGGGGVYVGSGGTFTLNGGTVYGNSAAGAGANANEVKSLDGKSIINSGGGAALGGPGYYGGGSAKWGTDSSKSYTKGGAPQTPGSNIGNSDQTLIATP